MKHQIIAGPDGKPAYAVIAWEDFLRLSDGALSDEELYDRAKAREEEYFPGELVQRLVDGVNPIKVFREYRGQTQRDLAEVVGISPVYLSQIETGHRSGSVKVMSAIATALRVDLDDIV